MIYSVYNWDNGKYDYFADKRPMPVADQSPKPRTVISSRAKTEGVAPDDIATRVPSDAKKVGSGAEAKGAIAVSGGVFDGPSWIKIGLLAGSAYLLMRVLR